MQSYHQNHYLSHHHQNHFDDTIAFDNVSVTSNTSVNLTNTTSFINTTNTSDVINTTNTTNTSSPPDEIPLESSVEIEFNETENLTFEVNETVSIQYIIANLDAGTSYRVIEEVEHKGEVYYPLSMDQSGVSQINNYLTVFEPEGESYKISEAYNSVGSYKYKVYVYLSSDTLNYDSEEIVQSVLVPIKIGAINITVE
jgi:hypothetical protein